MDPKACIAILSRSMQEHAAQHRRGKFCGSFCREDECVGCGVDEPMRLEVSASTTADTEAGAASPEGGADAAASADAGEPNGGGQVIDIKTGNNESIESIDAALSETTLLDQFPELGPAPGPVPEVRDAAAIGEGAAEGADAVAGEPAVSAAAGIVEGLARVGGTASESEGTANSTVSAASKGEGPATPVDCATPNGETEAASAPELVMMVVRLHEERVTVHKAYDAAFYYLLSQKCGAAKALARSYPFVVSCATARFKTLSDAVRSVATALEARAASSRDVAEGAALVRKLQRLEQTRLQLMAKNHLAQSQLFTGKGDEATVMQVDKILGYTSEEIEETVSELRCCAADLRDEAE